MVKHPPVLATHQGHHHGRKQPRSGGFAVSDILLVLATLWAVGLLLYMVAPRHRPKVPEYLMDPVLISYSYFEKDLIQVSQPQIFWNVCCVLANSHPHHVLCQLQPTPGTASPPSVQQYVEPFVTQLAHT